ncbi:serine/threonine-protein kinase [Roseateles sp.]|uniref:serine/threonine-protein kinase n=1 Tax=Roseateles sp. TaxID=1971397 RepID=UPI003265140B
MTASDDDLPTQIQPSPAPFDKTQRATPPAPVASSAAALGDGNSLPIGTRLAEFELTRMLGEGGFGIVYLSMDHSLHRKVALKEYMPSQLASRGTGTNVSVKAERYRDTFEAGLKSFINEARLLAQFDHPALVKVYRFWEANGTAYMVMPFYEGLTLKDTLKALPAPPDEAWLRGLLLPLAEALKVIHTEHCYHRDIAPDNIILLGSHTRPLLLDFGAARRVISDMTQALTVILKPGYAPLEQYAEVPHMKQGPWTDIYALAAVVYFAITRRTPPPSVGRMMGDTYVPLRQLAAGQYSESFLHAIDRALSVKPEDRPQSVAQLIAELDQPLPPTAALLPDDFGLDDDRTIIRPVRAGAPMPPPQTAASPAAAPRIAQPVAGPIPAPAPTAVAAPARTSSRTPLFVGAGALGLVTLGVVAYLSLTSTPAKRSAPELTPPVLAQPSAPMPSGAENTLATPAPTPPAPTPAAAVTSIDPGADFERILAGQSAGFKVDVAAKKTRLRIGHDQLSFTIRSERDGYYHVLALGPDGSLIQLMPNAVLKQHRIKAGETVTLPGPAMPMDVSAPAGAEQLLVIVSATPRSLSALTIGVDSGLTELAVGAKAAGMLGDQAGRQPAYLGKPVCPASGDCGQDYGAAKLVFDIVP